MPHLLVGDGSALLQSLTDTVIPHMGDLDMLFIFPLGLSHAAVRTVYQINIFAAFLPYDKDSVLIVSGSGESQGTRLISHTRHLHVQRQDLGLALSDQNGVLVVGGK